MGTGYLRVVTSTANGNLPAKTNITISYGDESLHVVETNISGTSEIIALDAPQLELTLNPNITDTPYSVYNIKAEADGFAPVRIHGVRVFDTITSILPINMALTWEAAPQVHYIPAHNLIDPSPNPTEKPPLKGPLNEIQIPEYITVHLGHPDSDAPNIPIPFTNYIKNISSQAIYPTWPPAAIEANIYAIISLALNQIYTEWYKAQGYYFDVTKHDQAFVEGGQTYHNIDEMVNHIFNRYITQEGSTAPLYADYSDGRHITCPGMWQWGTVDLANRGHNALEILRQYYPKDVQIVETSNVGGVEVPFPGYPLQEGMKGHYVQKLQEMLNHIHASYPEIPEINPITGIFGPETTAAIQKFKSIYEPYHAHPTGIVEKSTWHRISQIYSAMKHADKQKDADNTRAEVNLSQRTSNQSGKYVPANQLLTMFMMSRLVSQAPYL